MRLSGVSRTIKTSLRRSFSTTSAARVSSVGVTPLAISARLRIEQGAELLRPSVLYAQITGTNEKLERVEVGGSAVIVARGEFRFVAPIEHAK